MLTRRMLTSTSYNAQRLAMTRGRTVGMLQALAGHCSLLCFSGLLISKLEGYLTLSWWYVFVPLWVFHGVAARGRFSLPAPAPPHDRQWAPCHTVVAVPLLVAFELLLCCYLATLEAGHTQVVSLKVVFLPLLVFQAIILIDNFRMCRALMPGDEESMTDEAIWETLPHFWVAVSMVFFLAATMFTLLKLSGVNVLEMLHIGNNMYFRKQDTHGCDYVSAHFIPVACFDSSVGDVGALGWWDLFINFGIAECFSFLVCTKWSNPTIQRDAVFHSGSGVHSSISPLISMSSVMHDAAHSSSSTNDEDDASDGMCGRQEIGGHLLKIPVLVFQVLLCMRLEGTPSKARHLPIIVIFAPLLLVQVLACIFAMIRLLEQFWLMLRLGDSHSNPMAVFAKLNDCCGFLHHGSRLLGWWSIDETSREEHARLYSADSSSYHTFAGPAPEVVKKMARKDLAEEVWRLQAVLGEQAEITKHQQQEFDRLQNDKVLCRICFERDIAVVLLPCRHRILCSFCSEKCKQCPVCRGSIAERMPVYDV